MDWQPVFCLGYGPNPNCKHDVEYEFRRGDGEPFSGRLDNFHPAFNVAGGLMFRQIADSGNSINAHLAAQAIASGDYAKGQTDAQQGD